MVAVAFGVVILSGCNSSWIKRDESTPLASAPIEARSRPSAAVPGARPMPPTPAAPAPVQEPVQARDTWARLRGNYALPPIINADVRRELQWYASHPKYLREAAERARPYLQFITQEIEARKLPGELALLPILESGYQPEVASPYGAAGLWQFMGGTGTKFGLEINRWYDGRRDVTRSTGAALNYLQALHDRFDGDWLMAVAAYNAGWGNIEKAVAQQRRTGKPTDFWSLDVTQETRNLVARLIALGMVFKTPERYGVALPAIPDRPYFRSVELRKPTDLKRFQVALGLDHEEFRRLNPAYLRGHTGPGTAQILVPVAYVDEAARLADSLPASELPRLADATSGTATAQTASGAGKTHRVSAGESLWTIAHLHGVDLQALAKANRLNGRSTLRVGQRLAVPGSTMNGGPVKASVTAPRRYTVRNGDSLWTISKQFKVSIEQLVAWNGLTQKRQLQPGQELVVRDET